MMVAARLTSIAAIFFIEWAARVQNLAEGDEICITEDVYGAPAVAEIIAPYPVAKSEAELKGVSKPMSVYHLARTAS